MCKRASLREVFAALLAVLLLGLGPGPALANPEGGNDDNEQRDTQSRNEQGRLDSIPLRTEAGLFYIHRVVTIQNRYIHVTDSFNENVGIDYDNLDRADVSEVPLLGSLFNAPLRGDDLTEQNRVGAVYRGGDGTLVAVLNDRVNAGASDVSVVNGKGRYTFGMVPQIVQVDPAELGELGTLESVQGLLRGTATRETAIVIGGLTATSEPPAETKIPLLGDIPALRKLFLGNAYEVAEDELVIVVKPTLILGDEVQ